MSIVRDGMCYDDDTPEEVIGVLENARRSGRRVRVFYGDTSRRDFKKVHGHAPEVGLDWCASYPTIGYVGKSTGESIPLLVYNRRSVGGDALSTNAIVKILVKTRRGFYCAYKHPSYHQPEISIKPCPDKIGDVDMASAGYVAGVYARGENIANFKSLDRAWRFVMFLNGQRFSQ